MMCKRLQFPENELCQTGFSIYREVITTIFNIKIGIALANYLQNHHRKPVKCLHGRKHAFEENPLGDFVGEMETFVFRPHYKQFCIP